MTIIPKIINSKIRHTLLITFVVFSIFYPSKIKAQSESFTYTAYYNNPQIIHDVAQKDGDYYLVGERLPLEDNISQQWYLKLGASGDFVVDSVVPDGEGYWSNVFNMNDGIILCMSHYASTEPEYIESLVAGANENFGFTTLFGDQTGFVQNAKIIDNSHLITLGYESITNFIHLGTIKMYDLNNTWDDSDYIELFQSAFPIDMYDIVKLGESYRLFLKNYQSGSSSGVLMLKLNENFEIVLSTELKTSYQEFGSDGKFYGPVSAYALSDTTYLVHGSAPHPLSETEVNVRDGVTAVFDTSGTELSLIFTGVADTNAYSSRHSIAKGDGFFYLANTKNFNGEHTDATSYFMLTKMDAAGDVLWTKYYGNETSLKLTNVIATDDGGALMVGESQYTDNDPWYNIYVVKVGANGELTAIANTQEPAFSTYVFPNPSSSEIQIGIPEELYGKATLEIYTLSGKLILNMSDYSGGKLDISKFPPGVYIYQLSAGEYKSSGKIAIVR